jgi:hypothetical protein
MMMITRDVRDTAGKLKLKAALFIICLLFLSRASFSMAEDIIYPGSLITDPYNAPGTGINGAPVLTAVTSSDNTVTVTDAGNVDAHIIGGVSYSDDNTDAKAVSNDVKIINSEVNSSYNVYGGYAHSVDGDTTASGNTMSVSGSNISEWVVGGYAESANGNATTIGNTVSVSNGSNINGRVVGGYADTENGDAAASGNTVNVSNGSNIISEWVFGGHAESTNGGAIASGNTVSVSGGSNINERVIGGGAYSMSGNGNTIANGNIVNVSSGSQVHGTVIGGDARSENGDATASGNTVNISGGSNISGAWLIGGNADTENGDAIASGNTVSVSDSKVSGGINGGYAYSGNGAATATHNTVTLSGATVIGGDLFGGDGFGGGSDVDLFTGNTLNIVNPAAERPPRLEIVLSSSKPECWMSGTSTKPRPPAKKALPCSIITASTRIPRPTRLPPPWPARWSILR